MKCTGPDGLFEAKQHHWSLKAGNTVDIDSLGIIVVQFCPVCVIWNFTFWDEDLYEFGVRRSHYRIRDSGWMLKFVRLLCFLFWLVFHTLFVANKDLWIGCPPDNSKFLVWSLYVQLVSRRDGALSLSLSPCIQLAYLANQSAGFPITDLQKSSPGPPISKLLLVWSS